MQKAPCDHLATMQNCIEHAAHFNCWSLSLSFSIDQQIFVCKSLKSKCNVIYGFYIITALGYDRTSTLDLYIYFSMVVFVCVCVCVVFALVSTYFICITVMWVRAVMVKHHRQILPFNIFRLLLCHNAFNNWLRQHFTLKHAKFDQAHFKFKGFFANDLCWSE